MLIQFISKTDRSILSGSNTGIFKLNAIDENGNAFNREAFRGVFSAPFTNCVPCYKGSEFPTSFYTDSWLTAGGQQTPNEMVNLGGLTVSESTFKVPIQFPFGRLFSKYVQISLNGSIRVRDNRPQTYQIIHTDPSVSMTGIMKIRYRRSLGIPGRVEWIDVEIWASKPN